MLNDRLWLWQRSIIQNWPSNLIQKSTLLNKPCPMPCLNGISALKKKESPIISRTFAIVLLGHRFLASCQVCIRQLGTHLPLQTLIFKACMLLACRWMGLFPFFQELNITNHAKSRESVTLCNLYFNNEEERHESVEEMRVCQDSRWLTTECVDWARSVRGCMSWVKCEKQKRLFVTKA